MPNYVQKTLKQTTVAPGRHGRMYLGAYVPADFKHQMNAARIPSDSIQRIMIEKTKMEFASEFWRFMRVRKKFWLLPILIMTFVFGGLVVLTKGSAIAPFVYTFF